jgi:hypothetical protein
MSSSSYAVYFIHAPVLIILALSLKRLSLPSLLKWAMVSPLVILLCFAIAYLLKNVPLVRRIL